MREHRLYQADWLMRFYKFDVTELTTPQEPNLDLQIDPKLAWALRNRSYFPVDVNKATREQMLRIPGVGVQSVNKLLRIRRFHKITLGDLGKIAQEMREVQTDLAQSAVSPETMQKQDRILSRLLDAQRSARERDFEKRRRSESGRDVARPGPGPLDLTSQEGKNRLRRDLLKALEQGYARDYQELIKKYFDALEQQNP